MKRRKIKNPPKFQRKNAAKFARKIREIVKKFRQVTVKMDTHGIKEKIAHHTRPVG